jgi:hypothetical protein
MKKIIYLSSLILVLCSCSEEQEKKSFYSYGMQAHDVWRLPIIEPYQLITASRIRVNTWNFSPHSKLGKAFKIGLTVDSLNVDKGIILIYNPLNDNNWVALNINEKTTTEFTDRSSFDEFIVENKLSQKLYSTEVVYKAWEKTGQLPWGEEILKQSNE